VNWPDSLGSGCLTLSLAIQVAGAPYIPIIAALQAFSLPWANILQACIGLHKKNVEVLIHTRLQPGDRWYQEKGKPFKRFPSYACGRSSPG